MLRVCQSLSQSAKRSFQASYQVLSWSLLSFFPVSLQLRFKTRVAAQLHPPYEHKTTQTSSDRAKPSVDETITNTYWKRRFIMNMRIRKPISPLRLPREEQEACSTKTHPNNGAPAVVIHPIHRNLLYRQPDPVTHRDDESSHPHISSFGAYPEVPEDPKSRADLLQIISKTQLVSEAWEAYTTLLSVHKSHATLSTDLAGSPSSNVHKEIIIPYPHLHRLARLLSTTRPRTRLLFLRLLSVLTTLRSTGGPIFLWEWNALMDCAGKGRRKVNIQDYKAAIDIFQDMVTSNQAASSLSEPRHTPSQWRDMLPAKSLPIEQPDIFTFTTLLNIASRTSNDQAVQHALSLLAASDLPWNNVTHMARLPYFMHTNQLRAIRGIMLICVARGLDIVSLNGCLWAYAYKGRLRIVMQVYRLLRRNIPAEDRAYIDESDPVPFSLDPESYTGANSQDENPFFSIPGFITRATMAPDAVTYTLIIQALCYHGDLIGALVVFRDMVSTVDPTLRPPGSSGGQDQSIYYHKPNYAIYRAIFLGFVRHANKQPPTLASTLMSKQQGIDSVPLKEFAARLTTNPKPSVSCPSPEELAVETPWTLDNLEKIYERFLEMDWGPGGTNSADMTAPLRPTGRMIYWIMAAYAKTTKGDRQKMHEAWKQLDARFGYESDGVKLGGRLGRIARELANGQTSGGDPQ